jgi:hypothetical protein
MRTKKEHVSAETWGEVMPLLALGYMLVLSWAFFDGLHAWWGTGAIINVIAFGVFAALIPFGGLFISAVAFYGAYAVWHWQWWTAGLFAFPGVALTIAAVAITGVLGIWDSLRNRRQPY